MGSSIDCHPPQPQPHLTLYGRDYAAKKRATTEAAFSDLKMIQSIARTMTRKPDIPERKGPVSLNADARKSEIFRIMKENHRLLDRLETLEPIVSTTELVKQHKDKKRYTILVSHSKRLAGEYDNDVMRIRMEDKAKSDAMNRSVQARMTRYQQQQSMSMPSLTPLAATDPGVLTNQASPAPKRPAKPVVTRPLGGNAGSAGLGGSSSSKSAPAPVAATSVPSEGATGERKVSFPDISVPQDGNRSEWQRQGGPTPHPKKIPSELFYEDPAAAEPASAEAAPAPEFDPGQGQPSESPPKAKEGDSYGEDYEEDFADATQNSLSKAMDDTFEGSGAFEDSKQG